MEIILIPAPSVEVIPMSMGTERPASCVMDVGISWKHVINVKGKER
jgi:hypothetical protein